MDPCGRFLTSNIPRDPSPHRHKVERHRLLRKLEDLANRGIVERPHGNGSKIHRLCLEVDILGSMPGLHVYELHPPFFAVFCDRSLGVRGDDERCRGVADLSLVARRNLEGLPQVPSLEADELMPRGIVVVGPRLEIGDASRDEVDLQGVKCAGGRCGPVARAVRDPLRCPEDLPDLGERERRFGIDPDRPPVAECLLYGDAALGPWLGVGDDTLFLWCRRAVLTRCLECTDTSCGKNCHCEQRTDDDACVQISPIHNIEVKFLGYDDYRFILSFLHYLLPPLSAVSDQ